MDDVCTGDTASGSCGWPGPNLPRGLCMCATALPSAKSGLFIFKGLLKKKRKRRRKKKVRKEEEEKEKKKKERAGGVGTL